MYAGRCPGALDLGTMLAVCTTNATRAGASLNGSGKGKLNSVLLALFFTCLIAASACGVCEPCPKIFN